MNTDTPRRDIAGLLSSILRVVSSTLDERTIGQTVVDEAVKLLGADRSAIYLLDDARTMMLPFVAVDTRDPATVESLFYPNPIPLAAQPLFEEIVAHPAPLAVADTFDDPRTSRAFFERFDTRAVLMAPLLAREDRLLGMLGFFWVGRTHSAGDDDLALADALGRLAAVSFENARAQRRAESQAHELAAIFSQVPAGLALYDTSPEFRCIRHNDAYLQLLGRDLQARGSVAGLPLRALFDADSYLAIRQVFETVLATGEVYVLDEYAAVLPPDPRPRYYTWSLTPVKAGDRGVAGLLGAAIEVTEQVRARERAAELARLAADKTAQLQLIIESLADGVWVCDAHGRVVEVNRRAMDLLGMYRKEESLRPLDDYERLIETRYPDGTPMPHEEFPLIRALAGAPIVGDLVLRNVRTGDDTWLQVSAAPLYDEQRRVTGAVAVGRDITEHAELTRQKGEFLSLVAHELKTPITVIKGFGQSIERSYRQKLAGSASSEAFGEAELRKYAGQIGQIVRQTGRLDRLVDDLLDLSRLEDSRAPLNRRILNLADLLAVVVDRFQAAIVTHRIDLTLTAPEAYVDGEAERLEHVVTNLLQNAAKYSPAGAPIDVSIEADSQSARVVVRDRGIGVPSEDQPNLFSRFFRASNAPVQRYGGLGLGLFLSAEIVKRHGGRMGFESREGEGSAFWFELPLVTHT